MRSRRLVAIVVGHPKLTYFSTPVRSEFPVTLRTCNRLFTAPAILLSSLSFGSNLHRVSRSGQSIAEIVNNTSFTINGYREATHSLDYLADRQHQLHERRWRLLAWSAAGQKDQLQFELVVSGVGRVP